MLIRNGVLVSLFALAAFGQTSDKIFFFTHLEAPAQMQSVLNAVRSIGDIRDASVDLGKRSLTVKGTADEIVFAGRLIAELDRTDSAPGPRDLPFNDGSAPLAQIYYLRHVDNPQDLLEIVNAVRSVADIHRFLPVSPQNAIVMRGSPAQVKVVDWLLGVLDRPAGSPPPSAPQQYRLSAADWDPRSGVVAQVVALTHLETPQAIQDVVNAVRSVTDILRCFPIQSRRFLVMRATDDQIAVANWLLKELDGTAGQGTKEFKISGAGNQVALVAYVNASTPQSLQETVNQIRNQTKIQRVYPFGPQSAVVLRGTADQLSQSQQVIESRKGQ